MKKKIISILVVMLLIVTAGITVVGTVEKKNESQEMENNNDELVTIFDSPPDLTSMGINICCDQIGGIKRILAFDFPCNLKGWLVEIHLFGSWKDDVKASIDKFNLTIYSDIPKNQSSTNYSMPNVSLWSRDIPHSNITETPYAHGIQEMWWDPYTGDTSSDTQIWEYNITIPVNKAFLQQGTSSNPIVYWLAVHAVVNGSGRFGLKTGKIWMDDAVMRDYNNPHTWTELHHPEYGQSVDFAGKIKMKKLPHIIIVNNGPLNILVDVVSITNTGNDTLSNVGWSLTVTGTGGLYVRNSTNNGVLGQLEPGKTQTIKSKLVFGFGPCQVTVGLMGYTVILKKYVFGIFILNKKS